MEVELEEKESVIIQDKDKEYHQLCMNKNHIMGGD